MTEVGQVPDPNGPTPLTDTPSEAAQFGAGKSILGPPAMPVHGPGLPPGQRVVLNSSTGPAALNGSTGTVGGSTYTLALTAPALVANPR